MIKGSSVIINGDGETSRDFCYVKNAIQANILAATALDSLIRNKSFDERIFRSPRNKIFNIAVGDRTTLKQLYLYLSSILETRLEKTKIKEPLYDDYRKGDIRDSLADISKAKTLLGYIPTHNIHNGLVETVDWYVKYN